MRPAVQPAGVVQDVPLARPQRHGHHVGRGERGQPGNQLLHIGGIAGEFVQPQADRHPAIPAGLEDRAKMTARTPEKRRPGPRQCPQCMRVLAGEDVVKQASVYRKRLATMIRSRGAGHHEQDRRLRDNGTVGVRVQFGAGEASEPRLRAVTAARDHGHPVRLRITVRVDVHQPPSRIHQGGTVSDTPERCEPVFSQLAEQLIPAFGIAQVADFQDTKF